MPVRRNKNLKPQSTLSEIFERAAIIIESNQAFQVFDFVRILLELHSLRKPCKNIQESYLITLISGILYERISHEKSSSNVSRCKNLLPEILNQHINSKGLSDNSIILKIGQLILNELEPIVSQYLLQQSTDPLILIYIKLLQLVQITPFELMLFALLKTQQNHSSQSVFNLFINECSPYLPIFNLKPFTLVLDLDETLGHFDGKKFYIRPGCHDFLKGLSVFYELVLFTSAEETYANQAMKVVDADFLVKFRLYRQHLSLHEGKPVKDISKLGRNLKDIIIVDDRYSNFRLQPENGVHITPWYGEGEDEELNKLKIFLIKLVYHCKGNLVESLKSLQV
ncbi:hypothetical protein SteCoe_10538 [Stentor coeruleus]|uniref:Mitochondrial import inner membrane translocase subunit TIM50 n=1 Tax=Stentor coeruleus TaxID=5963 RepID=A0A1R2CFA5_9CILI|nr:hypothetical protein SteCoe_10538 [Stentor coeruleus]